MGILREGYITVNMIKFLLLGFGYQVTYVAKHIKLILRSCCKGRYNERGVQKEFGRAIGIINIK
ncbi:hypothetical protein DMN57_20255 [Escherichia coli]|nr:hypothetical protein [Escherichia coli]